MSSGPVVDPAARIAYAGQGVTDDEAARGPWDVLRRWYAEAAADPRVDEPGAVVVATVDADGRPDARTVLLKAMSPQGLDFYTNLASAKARQLDAAPVAALVLPWHEMHRQVRVRGDVEAVDRQAAAAYFASRPRDSQLAAWASHQSAPTAGRDDLLAAVEAQRHRFEGGEVPLPPFWGGFRVRPVEVECWAGQDSRLHDRTVWTSRSGSPAPLDDPAAWTPGRRQP